MKTWKKIYILWKKDIPLLQVVPSKLEPLLTRSQVSCWAHLRVQLCVIVKSWDLRACTRLSTLKRVEGCARSLGIWLGRGQVFSLTQSASKPTTRGLVYIREHPWVLGQATPTEPWFPHNVGSISYRSMLPLELRPSCPRDSCFLRT
jgi:hypothetical protein